MKYFIAFLIIVSFLVFAGFKSNTNTKADSEYIHFATSAEYPPFEYNEQGSIKGFDIDLARMIAKKAGKKAVFENMRFSSILPALLSRQVDAAISTITITADRKKNFDFSDPYYFEGMAVVFKKASPVHKLTDLAGKKVAVQLGTVMEIWLKKHASHTEIVTMDNNNQAIATLKADHVDAVLLDGAQGLVFSQKNPGLSYSMLGKAKDGYGIILNKKSPLTAEINLALKSLRETGELQKLEKKWLGDFSWKK